MPDPTDQPTPATPDELAALYLRARDVPCPGCGYNRRDGTNHICPECGHRIVLSEKRYGIHRDTQANTSVIAVVICICSILATGVMFKLFLGGFRSWRGPAALLLTAVAAAFTINGVKRARASMSLNDQSIIWKFHSMIAFAAIFHLVALIILVF